MLWPSMVRGRGRPQLRLASLLALMAVAGQAQDILRFTESENGSYEFNTGVLSGKLRNDGKSVGLLPVTWLATGEVLTRSMGWSGHYRVFSGSQRFDAGAWYWPSTSKLLADGSVEVIWPAAEDRPFELSAVYCWTGPETLDVETRVRPLADLPDFESFVAFYFNSQFTESAVLSNKKWIAAEQSEGAWQMFPRDAKAVRLIQDGRWKVPPNPVDWIIRPAFQRPVGLRRAPALGITALIMCRECFAISTPHQTEAHYSMYLSLFGKTVRKGETATSHARLILLPSATPEKVIRLYDAFNRNRAPRRKAR